MIMHADEDAFQQHLDANPNDCTARLVFADWLEEQGDPRAEGYRAMGALHMCSLGYEATDGGVRWYHPYGPEEWHAAINPDDPVTGIMRDVFPDRRDVDDAYTLAFARLPTTLRVELLARASA
jgi:uncharacterized protein (TIGR02996 family)